MNGTPGPEPCQRCGRPKTAYLDLGTRGAFACVRCTESVGESA